MLSEGSFDIIVFGAGATSQCSWNLLYISLHAQYLGISGLAFARFYLDIHPECRLALLEEDSCVGGVWSSSKSGHPSSNDAEQVLFISMTKYRALI